MMDGMESRGDGDASNEDRRRDGKATPQPTAMNRAITARAIAEGRVPTPAEIGRVAYMIQRLIAVERCGAAMPDEGDGTRADPSGGDTR
jgi:hypothetical protein